MIAAEHGVHLTKLPRAQQRCPPWGRSRTAALSARRLARIIPLHRARAGCPSVDEALTRIAETHAPDSRYDEVSRHFEDKELVDLTTLIGLINPWKPRRPARWS
jgi:alkylhydroperoxidase family enzyme